MMAVFNKAGVVPDQYRHDGCIRQVLYLINADMMAV